MRKVSRKRGRAYAQKPYRAPRRTRAYVPGRDRRVGYYGRYNRQPYSGEMKFHDVDLDDAVVASGGVITDTINIIPQGVTEVQRLGRKCTIAKIGWRYRIQLPAVASAGTGGETIRVIMYLDKQCNGATAATTDILETASFQSFRNLTNVGRFSILHDKTFALNSHGAAGDGTANDALSWELNHTFWKNCNIPLEFDSTTGALTEIRSNNIGVLLLSNNGLVSFTSKIRLRFRG